MTVIVMQTAVTEGTLLAETTGGTTDETTTGGLIGTNAKQTAICHRENPGRLREDMRPRPNHPLAHPRRMLIRLALRKGRDVSVQTLPKHRGMSWRHREDHPSLIWPRREMPHGSLRSRFILLAVPNQHEQPSQAVPRHRRPRFLKCLRLAPCQLDLSKLLARQPSTAPLPMFGSIPSLTGNLHNNLLQPALCSHPLYNLLTRPLSRLLNQRLNFLLHKPPSLQLNLPLHPPLNLPPNPVLNLLLYLRLHLLLNFLFSLRLRLRLRLPLRLLLRALLRLLLSLPYKPPFKHSQPHNLHKPRRLRLLTRIKSRLIELRQPLQRLQRPLRWCHPLDLKPRESPRRLAWKPKTHGTGLKRRRRIGGPNRDRNHLQCSHRNPVRQT
jgi:hypothetical protein